MSLTADSWPIGAALLPFPAVDAAGRAVQDAPASEWKRMFDEVAHAGFDCVDITTTCLRPGELEDQRVHELADTVRLAGLRVSSISLSRQSIIDPDESVAQSNLLATLRTIDSAVVLATNVVGVSLSRPLTPAQQQSEWFWLAPGEGDPHDDTRRWDKAIGRMREIGTYAADRGVQISLEMYEDTYVGSADMAVRLIRGVGLANVGLNPDLGNLLRLHRPIETWSATLEKVLPYTNFWHVKNYVRDFDPATGAYFTAPATLEAGTIDYRRALRMALDAGFDGPICVEHYGGDGLSVSARNRDYLRGLLEFHLRDPY